MKFENVIQDAHFGYLLLQENNIGQNATQDWLIIECNKTFASLSGLQDKKNTVKSLNMHAEEDNPGLFNWKLLRLYLSSGQQYLTYIQPWQDNLSKYRVVISFSGEYITVMLFNISIAMLSDRTFSEEIYRRLIELSPDIYYIYSTKRGRSFHSDQTTHILGYTPAHLKENPELWYNCIHPDDKSSVDIALRNALKRIPINIEYRIQTSQGNWIWLHDRSLHIHILESETLIEGIAIDITARKNADKKLQIITQTYENILNSLTEAIYIQDSKGVFIDVNKGAEIMYGFSREELIGKSPKTVAAPGFNDMEMINKKMSDAAQTGKPVSFEFWGRRKNGEFFPKDVIVNKGTYFDQEVFIATARDITERKKIESELVNSEEKYRQIAENISDVVFTCNLQFEFTYISPSIEKLYGEKAEGAILKPFSALFPPKTHEKIRSHIDNKQNKSKKQLNRKNDSILIEDEFFMIDGNSLHVSTSISIIRDKYGNTTGFLGVTRDISQTKKAEAKLEKSEERFRQLVTLLPVAVFETNADYQVTFANKVASEMFGYDDRDFARGFNSLNILSPEEKERALRILLEKGTINQIEIFDFNAIRKNGTIFPVQLYLSEIKQDGLHSGYRGIIIDISEKKKAIEHEFMLRNQLRQVLDLVPSYIFAKDYDGKFLMANKSLADLFGVTPDEVIGKTDADYGATEEQVDWYRKNDRAVMDSGKEVFVKEEQVLRKDGTLGWFQTNKIPYQHYGLEKPAIMGIAVDITERKEAEAQLKESEEKFRSLALLSPFAIMIYQGDKWVYTNPAGEQITGYSAEELNSMNYWDFISPEFINVIKDRGKKRQAGEAISKNFEMKIISKDGNEKWIFLNGTLIEYRGLPAGLIAFADITNRKIIEVDLLKAKDRAEESDRLKSAFLANLSHEIRTPMNGIMGFLSLLKEINLTEEEKSMYIEVVNESGQRLLNTINDIIEMSKIESKQIEVHLSDVNIEKEMQFHYDFFIAQAEKKGISLKLKETISGNEAFIESDKSKLNGILSNLINNAIKFTDSGFVEIGNYIEKHAVTFYVKDTGIGIPHESMNAIFERFVHVNQTVTRAHEGTGLGLSIAKAYVELLGGKIWVISDEGKGSTFYFTVPYRQSGRKISATGLNVSQSQSIEPGLTVLVAEDDEISYKFIECILSRENIRLIHTSNGEDAVRLVSENPEISIVLMDIRMPVMNGIEATKQIRRFNLNIPIIAQTAYALDGDRAQLIEIGCNDYIAKPVKRDTLINLIIEYTSKNLQ